MFQVSSLAGSQHEAVTDGEQGQDEGNDVGPVAIWKALGSRPARDKLLLVRFLASKTPLRQWVRITK